MRRNLTNEEFICQANKIHNFKYDYSKSIYTKKKDKLLIICSKHGEFSQTADTHIQGAGCPKCKADKNRLSLDKFIEKSNNIHNSFYNYDKTNYVRTNIKVTIICPIHGEFYQTPNSHLNGKGCYNCGWENHSGSYGSVFKYNPDFEIFIYLIKCYKEEEIFYKIGLSKNTKQRFFDIPYKKDIVKISKGKIKDLYPLEQKIRKHVKNFKYLPLHDFSGKNECFILSEDTDMLSYILSSFPDL